MIPLPLTMTCASRGQTSGRLELRSLLFWPQIWGSHAPSFDSLHMLRDADWHAYSPPLARTEPSRQTLQRVNVLFTCRDLLRNIERQHSRAADPACYMGLIPIL
jgi:hypothetical protein